MKKCIYLTEGECEEKLVKALKEKPCIFLQSIYGSQCRELKLTIPFPDVNARFFQSP